MAEEQFLDPEELRRRAMGAPAPVAPPTNAPSPVGSAVPMAIPKASVPVPSTTIPAVSVPKIGPAQTELNRLESTGSGVSQIKNPWLHGLAKVGDVLGTIAAPRIAAAIPGTTIHHNLQVARQEGLANEEAGYAEKQAQAGHVNAETAALQNPPDKPASNDVELFQQDPAQYEKFLNAKAENTPDKAINPERETFDYMTKKLGMTPSEAYEQIKSAGQRPQTQNFDEQSYQEQLKAHPGLTRLQYDQMKSRATEKPQKDPQQLAIGPDGKVIALRPGVQVAPGTKSVSGELGGAKASADEQRRGDLSNNLNENLDQLEDILNRRGNDLFGPFAGRATKFKQFVGTDDPDIGALENIQHQIGITKISSHGMRSAQGIQSAADSLLNSFKNGPNAVRAAIKSTRDSVQTFIHDAEKGQQPQGAPQGGGGGGMINVQIPGHPPGQIPAAAKDQFIKDNPGAKVLQ